MKQLIIIVCLVCFGASPVFAHPQGGKPHAHPKAAKPMPPKVAKAKRGEWCKKHPKQCAEKRAKRKQWCKKHPKACAKQRAEQGGGTTNTKE